MEPKWTEVAQALGSIGACLVALFGVLAVLKQVKQIKAALHGDTHATLFSQNFEVLKLFSDHPEIRPYFYANQEILEGQEHYDQAFIIAIVVADYLETVALQRPNMPQDVWRRWEQVILDSYTMSPIVREIFAINSGWYSEDILRLLPGDPIKSFLKTTD